MLINDEYALAESAQQLAVSITISMSSSYIVNQIWLRLPIPNLML